MERAQLQTRSEHRRTLMFSGGRWQAVLVLVEASQYELVQANSQPPPNRRSKLCIRERAQVEFNVSSL